MCLQNMESKSALPWRLCFYPWPSQTVLVVLENNAVVLKENAVELEEYSDLLEEKVDLRTQQLSEANADLNHKNKLIEDTNTELSKKNQQIHDSLQYAVTMQHSLIPDENIPTCAIKTLSYTYS